MWRPLARPTLGLRLPDPARAGELLACAVSIDCPRALDVASIDIAIEGHERWRRGFTERSAAFLHLAARVSGARTLDAGHTELPFRVPLDAAAPASYRGSHAEIAYRARVELKHGAGRVERAEAPLVVRRDAPPAAVRAGGAVFKAPAGAVRFELGLGSTRAHAGALVHGAIALLDRPRADVRFVVSLQASERAVGEPAEVPARRYQIELAPRGDGPAETMTFRLRVPHDAPPGFDFGPRPGGAPGLCALGWRLELELVGAVASPALHVPFEILSSEIAPAAKDALVAEPPAVGEARQRALWASAGARYGMSLEGERLLGGAGGCTFSIERPRPGGDDRILAALRYPDLRLGARLDLGGGEGTGDRVDAWIHALEARDGAQTMAFLRALEPALTAPLSLVRLDDRMLEVAAPAAADVPELERVLAAVDTLAQQLERARRHLPPPSSMAAGLDAWRGLADRLGGTLEPACMAVSGWIGGTPVRIETELDGEGSPVGTRLVAGEPSAGGARWHAADGSVEACLERSMPGEVGAFLARLARDAHELAWGRDHLVLCLSAALEAGPRALTVHHAEQRLARMVELLPWLGRAASPYR